MKLKALIVFFLMGSMSLTAQKSYQLQSPDKKLQAVVTVVTIFVSHLHTTGLKFLPHLPSP